MSQLVRVVPGSAKVFGEQGDSLRQLNIRGGIMRFAGKDGGGNSSGIGAAGGGLNSLYRINAMRIVSSNADALFLFTPTLI